MSDEKLRELERRWKETGSLEDEARYLLERVRVGDLEQEKLELAAYCGHEGARIAASDSGEKSCGVVAGFLVARALTCLGQVLGEPWGSLYARIVESCAGSAMTGEIAANLRVLVEQFVSSAAEIPGATWEKLYPPAWGAQALQDERVDLLNQLVDHTREVAGAATVHEAVYTPVLGWCLARGRQHPSAQLPGS